MARQSLHIIPGRGMRNTEFVPVPGCVCTYPVNTGPGRVRGGVVRYDLDDRLWVARTTPRDQAGEPDVKPGFANRYEAACWLVEISGKHNAETIYGRARAA